MRALIDGDLITWRAAFAAQETWYDVYEGDALRDSFSKKTLAEEYVREDTDVYTIVPRPHPLPQYLARLFCDNMLDTIFEDTGCAHFTIYMGGSNNFRKIIYPEYKANRKGLPSPVHKEFVRKHLQTKYAAAIVDWVEADDALAVAQLDTFNTTKDLSGTVLCSFDKDMKQIPGNHYNIITREAYSINHTEAEANLYRQMLTGDVADNIPGIRGIGAKKSDKIIAECGGDIKKLTQVIKDKYEASGIDFDVNMALLRMLRTNQEWDDVVKTYGLPR